MRLYNSLALVVVWCLHHTSAFTAGVPFPIGYYHAGKVLSVKSLPSAPGLSKYSSMNAALPLQPATARRDVAFVSSHSASQRSSSSLMMVAASAASTTKKQEDSPGFKRFLQVADVVVNLFPVWTVLATGWALKRPSDFAWFSTEYFTAGLAMLMLSMGITLTPADFSNIMKSPSAIIVQFLLCYLVMPVLAFFLGKAFAVPPALLAGLVLVGSINGGQASNLCTYIARGDVALSVIMTTATTIGATVMTPLLCKALLGTVVPVDAAGIAWSTVQVVLGPIAVGMTANKFFPSAVKAVLPFAPLVGIFSTCLLVASAVAQVSGSILSAGWKLQLPVLLLHLLGGIIGYIIPWAMGFGEVASRTMAIETCMKSSAFGFLLAKLHFGQVR